jgi:hypothetical protein
MIVAEPLLLQWTMPGAEAVTFDLLLADRRLMRITDDRTIG